MYKFVLWSHSHFSCVHVSHSSQSWNHLVWDSLCLSLCLSHFLSPLNCHHLVLRSLSNCPRPLIVLINVVHFTWLCSFPIPRLFFQTHSFVSLWQTDKEELVGEVLYLWPMAAISYEGPWERDTHEKPALAWNTLYASLWTQTQSHSHKRCYSEL